MMFRTLTVSLLLISCASGDDGWNEKGFIATPAGARTWWVSFEEPTMTVERARDQLLYHTARLVLDKGAVYFTFHESRSRAVSTEPSSTASDQPIPLDRRRNVPTSYGHGDLARIAVAEIVDEGGPGVLEASKVIEELERKYAN